MRTGTSNWRFWPGCAGLLIIMALGCGQSDEAGMAPDHAGETAVSERSREKSDTKWSDSTRLSNDSVAGDSVDSHDVDVADRDSMELRAPELDSQDAPTVRRDSGNSPQSPTGSFRAVESSRHTMTREAPAVESLPPQPDRSKKTAPRHSTTAGDEPTELPVEIASTAQDQQPQMEEDPSPFDLVTVFYATDRHRIDSTGSPRSRLPWGAILASVVAVVIYTWFVVRIVRVPRPVKIGLTLPAVLGTTCLLGWWNPSPFDPSPQESPVAVQYGNQRGELDRGICQVSIPWSHRVGQLEAPSILRLEVREDVRKHVVVQTIDPRPEDEFFQQLRSCVESAERPDVFVFVHGFNVTFEQAARRTAQIAYDVKFQGAPVFFSWPSQGGLLKYTVDETNATWSVPHLKQFLLDIVKRSGAQSVNLIAHSMGNRAMTQAVRELQMELRSESALFHQIILAAPDVDAEIFRRDLAPALIQTANRVTLYASSNDQALLASKKVHGYARAGDTGDGLVVVAGIDTIDVSTIVTSLLGHSYYGSSNPVLSDIYALIHEARPANQRQWLRPMMQGDFPYWVLDKIQETATRSRP